MQNINIIHSYRLFLSFFLFRQRIIKKDIYLTPTEFFGIPPSLVQTIGLMLTRLLGRPQLQM